MLVTARGEVPAGCSGHYYGRDARGYFGHDWLDGGGCACRDECDERSGFGEAPEFGCGVIGEPGVGAKECAVEVGGV